MAKETVDKKTGLISEQGKLNVIREVVTKRPDGSTRIQWDYADCPTMTEQHTAHLSDINYLLEKYQPDELHAYLMARAERRIAIEGYDATLEPTYQEARNQVKRSRDLFDKLPDDVQGMFKNHVEFLKFMDSPANAEKMVALGLMKKVDLKAHTLAKPDKTDDVPLDGSENSPKNQQNKNAPSDKK